MKKETKKESASASKASSTVPQEQWDWYAGFTKDGKMLTLREYVKSNDVCDLDELTEDQVTQLTIRRIQAQPKLDIVRLRANAHQRIDKDIAIAHLQDEEDAAPFLRNIEKRILRELIPRARKQAKP
jgi:hypothetical protein